MTDPFQASHGCAMVIPLLDDSQISRNFGSPLDFIVFIIVVECAAPHNIRFFVVFKSIFRIFLFVTTFRDSFEPWKIPRG